MKDKTKKNIYFYIAIFGVIGTIIGAIYGYRKDKELKLIQRRANSPFFVVSALLIVPSNFYYRKELENIKDPFAERSLLDDANVPEDYPDNYPLGLSLKNTGSELRSFKIKSKEPSVFLKDSFSDSNKYELSYTYNKESKGKKIRFTIIYETSEGFQDEQVWEIEKGMTSIKRIKPEIP